MSSHGRISTRTNWRNMANALAIYAKFVADGGMRPALTKAGYWILDWLHREYRGLSRKEWPRISVVAVLLSKARIRRPIKNEQELQARAQSALPLIDTGETLGSLIPGRKFNLFKVSSKSVVVGSRSPILAAHQTGYSVQFQFTGQEYDLLKKNVAQHTTTTAGNTGRGAALGKLAVQRTGTNPFFTKMFLMLRAMSGKVYDVPARPLPTKVPDTILRRFRREAANLLMSQFKQTMRRGQRR